MDKIAELKAKELEEKLKKEQAAAYAAKISADAAEAEAAAAGKPNYAINEGEDRLISGSRV